MNAREERAFARLIRVAQQLRGRVRLSDLPPMFARFLEKLEVSIQLLHRLIQEQYSVQPKFAEEGKQTARLRKRLRREYMIPLARIGKKLLRFAPMVERTLKVPHAKVSHRALVTSAKAMLKAVQPHKGILISAGFPKTFFTEFRDLTRELERVTTTNSARREKFVRVSRALREELASASETLGILDGLVLGLADRDRGFAQTWKSLMRTPKPLGRPPAKARKRAPNEPPPHGSE